MRFLVGFGVGGLTVPFDTLSEFLPVSHRGVNLLVIEYVWTAGSLLVPVFAFISLGLDGGCFVATLFVYCVGFRVSFLPFWAHLSFQNRRDGLLQEGVRHKSWIFYETRQSPMDTRGSSGLVSTWYCTNKRGRTFHNA